MCFNSNLIAAHQNLIAAHQNLIAAHQNLIAAHQNLPYLLNMAVMLCSLNYAKGLNFVHY
jgi:hypothetical protein